MIIYFLLSLLIYIIYVFLKTKKSLHMLQQNRYNRGYKYVFWLRDNFKKNFGNYSLILFLTSVFFLFKNNFVMALMFNFLLFVVTFIFLREKVNVKVPLTVSARIKRLFITNMLIYIISIGLMIVWFKEEAMFVYYLILGILAYLNPVVVIFANFLNRPVERLVGLYYRNKTVKKLKQMNNLEVIGITGSYGKTSSKNILNDILNIKYNVLASPKNYNTPYGLMMSVNDYLDKFNDYFIAEMGACRKGEIKELCNLVKPKYGIITTIGLAHLETFGSKENIIKTKFELIESLPSDGLGILNSDDEAQVNYKLKNNVPIKWIGIDNEADVMAFDLKLSNEGTSFKVKFKNEKEVYDFKTKLLGRANVYNILAGVCLGRYLGIEIEQLKKAVLRVKPVEHRLELKRYNEVYIIDDAYNSNPKGAKMALEVLNLMPGTRVVVTPGMVELGKEDESVHLEFGKEMADCADKVILVGEKKTLNIKKGLLSKKFKEENIYVINDVMEAFKMIREFKKNGKDLYALIENDLPDIFNEGKK